MTNINLIIEKLKEKQSAIAELESKIVENSADLDLESASAELESAKADLESVLAELDLALKDPVVSFNDKERDSAVVKIYLELTDNLSKAKDFNKLNLIKFDYGYRVRSEKSPDGDLRVVDRGFLGFLDSKIESPGSENYKTMNLKDNCSYNCFIYGKRTLGFVINDNEVFANKNLQPSADFNCLLFNVAKAKNLSIVWLENMKTGESVKKPVESNLESCFDNIKSADSIESAILF